MSDKVTQDQINNVLWQACDTFRGTIDSSTYKDYILVMLFIKYMSDTYKEHYEEYYKRYEGNETRIKRALDRERFVLDENSTFDYLYSKRSSSDIGEIINKALAQIEESNKTKLRGVFKNIDFNSEAMLGNTKEKNAILKNLLEDFNKLDLKPSNLPGEDVIGNSYEYLISRFASDAGKKGGNSILPAMYQNYLPGWLNRKRMTVSMTQLVDQVPC